MANWLKRASRSDGPEEISYDAALHSLRYVVLDTELTSLDHRTNRLLSVGAIVMRGASIQLGEQFYRVVNPQVSIPAESIVIHKLRSHDVEAGESPEKSLDDFGRFIEGAVLVGHFVGIELRILRKEFAHIGRELNNPAIDTARIHQWILRHGRFSEDLAVQVEKVDLATLATFYNLEVQDVHHALCDAFLTARIWQRMQHTLQAKGIQSLRALLKIAGA